MDNHIIINVGRQIGAGGRTIAQLLAKEFDASFYDKELLALAAKESGFAPEFFEQNDEHKGFFRTLFHLHAPHVADNSFYANNFSQEGLLSFRVMLFARLPKKATVCLWGVVPTMCCATLPMPSISL